MVKLQSYVLKSLISLILLMTPAPSVATGQEKAPALSEMKMYYLTLLSRGPKWTPEQTPDTERIQGEHMKHIQKMAGDGKLVAAGPITDGGQLRGIFIFGVSSIEEAKALAESDPAVKAGRLAVEVHPWMSQKGIGERIAAQVKANPQANFEMTTYQLGLAHRGPKATSESTPESKQLQADHLSNIFKLIGSGKLGAAGPCMDGGNLNGVFMFQVGSMEEAKALVDADPFVKAGIIVVELHPWMAAKGTMP
jgi:uncharacterized protein YciI